MQCSSNSFKMPYPVVYCLLVYLGELLATKLCFCFQVEVGGIGPPQAWWTPPCLQVGAASARKALPEIFCVEHFVNTQSMEIHLPDNISCSVISQELKHLTNNGNTSNREHSVITREPLEAGGLPDALSSIGILLRQQGLWISKWSQGRFWPPWP